MLKIGVFDSGLGGLTVVKALQKVIKGAELFYVADTKNAPYGEKKIEQILQYSLDITRYFVKHHQIDALVVACNTATSAAIETLRIRYPQLIIVGTEPAIKPAIEQTKTGKVGVLATPATLSGDKYQQLADTLSTSKNVQLFEQACPGLVEQIEKGEVYSGKTKKMLEVWLRPMHENNVDTIVLGCTHYPLVSQLIKEIMNNKVVLLDAGKGIASRLNALMDDRNKMDNKDLKIHLYTTGSIDEKSAAIIVGHNSHFVKIKAN